MPPTSTTIACSGAGQAFGTCGELAQGVLPDGRRFHVTCPIDLGSEASVRVRPGPRLSVVATWQDAEKTVRALRLAAQLLELGNVEIEVDRTSALPPAKGMASSTADIVAAVRALARASGQDIDGMTMARLATSVESSDGVMFDGVVAVDHHSGELLRRWEWRPRFVIATFVPGASRRTSDAVLAAQHRIASEYETLLADIDAAMRRRDIAAVAAAATRSAILNEPFVANPLLPFLAPVLPAFDALGLCVGHSGTVCGLLFEAGSDGDQRAATAVEHLLPTLPCGTTSLITRTPG